MDSKSSSTTLSNANTRTHMLCICCDLISHLQINISMRVSKASLSVNEMNIHIWWFFPTDGKQSVLGDERNFTIYVEQDTTVVSAAFFEIEVCVAIALARSPRQLPADCPGKHTQIDDDYKHTDNKMKKKENEKNYSRELKRNNENQQQRNYN